MRLTTLCSGTNLSLFWFLNYLAPPLTTIDQTLGIMGVMAMEMLVKLVREKKPFR